MQVQGIDVSKWQGEVDWEMAAAAGAQFAFIRAGSIDNVAGNCYEDVQFPRNSELAPQHLPVGFYWYFRPNWSPIKQADFFVDRLKNSTWKLYPVVDVEEHGNLDKAGVSTAVHSFLGRVYQGLGVRPMVYTSAGFWDGRVAPTYWAIEYPLWIAHWNVQTPRLPYDWNDYGKTYTFWQTYVGQDGSQYGMKSHGLDHDVYNGDYEQFVRQFNLDGEVPPPEETMSVEDFVIEKVYPMMVEKWGYQGPKPVKGKQ
jgi:lysozyme